VYKQLKEKMSIVHTVAERRKVATSMPLYKQIVPAMYKLLEGRVKPSDFITVKYSPTVSLMILGFYGLFMRDEIERAFNNQTLVSTSTPLHIQDGGTHTSHTALSSEKMYALARHVRHDPELRKVYIEYVKYLALEIDAA
jgi:hypothetical protein